jgi:cytochrome P450 family 142 subfamily A polypeptide 1
MTATDARPVDLLDPYLYSGDPWPVYRWLRNEAPAYRDVNGIVGVSRHRDVSEVERNAELYSSASGSQARLVPFQVGRIGPPRGSRPEGRDGVD